VAERDPMWMNRTTRCRAGFQGSILVPMSLKSWCAMITNAPPRGASRKAMARRYQNDNSVIRTNIGNSDGTVGGRKAVMGALALYLEFINLFLSLLRLFGDRRD
jgi:hypothetical protein